MHKPCSLPQSLPPSSLRGYYSDSCRSYTLRRLLELSCLAAILKVLFSLLCRVPRLECYLNTLLDTKVKKRFNIAKKNQKNFNM